MDIKAEIKNIIQTYGMKNKKCAEIMGISETLFKAKISEKQRNKFTQENLDKLKEFLNNKPLN